MAEAETPKKNKKGKKPSTESPHNYCRCRKAALRILYGKTWNVKISAVRLLADICFLEVLIRLIRCIFVSVCVQVFKGC